MLSNHVAVEIDGNVKRFDREGLCQLQFLQHCIIVSLYHLFQLLHDRSTSALPPTYAVAMSLYQNIHTRLSKLRSLDNPIDV